MHFSTRREVVAELDVGMVYPVRGGDTIRLVEVYRPEMPWGRRPADGRTWTLHEEMAHRRRDRRAGGGRGGHLGTGGG